MRYRHILVYLTILYSFSCSTESGKTASGETKDLKLWYDQPAKVDNPEKKHIDRGWLKALPLGNGSLGVMVFGDVNSERIQLNEESIWSGGLTDNDNPDAHASLDKIRKLLFEGKYKEATDLTEKTQVCTGFVWGRDGTYGRFQTLGDLWIDKKNQAPYENYHRELDLEEAVVRVNYSQDGVDYHREIFTSYPDQVMVARFTADKPGKISLTCSLDRPERFRTYSENSQLIMKRGILRW